MKKLNNKGFGAIEAILTVLILTIVGGTGYYVYSQNQDKKVETSSAPAQTQKNTDQDSSEKTKFESKVREFSFEYPANWSVIKNEIEENDYSAYYDQSKREHLEIKSPNGTVMRWDSLIDGLGGPICLPEDEKAHVRSITPIPGIKNGYMIESGTKNETKTIGIVDTVDGKKPKVGETENCDFFLLYSMSKKDRIMFKTGLTATPKQEGDFNQEDLAQIKEIILSAKLSKD